MTLPAWVAPQLATLVAEPPVGADWVHEMKLDGLQQASALEADRAIAYVAFDALFLDRRDLRREPCTEVGLVCPEVGQAQPGRG